MNCKPGDTARIVGLPTSMADGNDRIVILADLPSVEVKGAPCWRLSRPIAIKVSGAASFPGRFADLRLQAGDTLNADYMPDAHLRPIRDPGDNTLDESHAWLPPVPFPSIEPALLDAEVCHG